MSNYDDVLPKNEHGYRTNLTCEICGFEPKTKNKYREKQDHQMRVHFMDKVNMIFPSFSNYNCPSPDCVFMAKDKQSFLRHYISKHGLIETFLRETLAERGIAWAPPGLDTTTPSKRQSSEGSTQYIVAQDFSDRGDGNEEINDDTIVLVALDDNNQAQVYETNVFEGDGEQNQVLTQLTMEGNVVSSITVIDPDDNSSQPKRKKIKMVNTPQPFVSQEAKKKKRKKRRQTNPEGEDSKTRTIRKILERSSDESSLSDSGSDASNLEYIEIPTSTRRLKKDAKNYQILQMFVVDLERENASLRRENQALRSRVDVLLDAMIEQKKSGGVLTEKSLQKINSVHKAQNVTLMSEVAKELRQSKPTESDQDDVGGSSTDEEVTEHETKII